MHKFEKLLLTVLCGLKKNERWYAKTSLISILYGLFCLCKIVHKRLTEKENTKLKLIYLSISVLCNASFCLVPVRLGLTESMKSFPEVTENGTLPDYTKMESTD